MLQANQGTGRPTLLGSPMALEMKGNNMTRTIKQRVARAERRWREKYDRSDMLTRNALQHWVSEICAAKDHAKKGMDERSSSAIAIVLRVWGR